MGGCLCLYVYDKFIHSIGMMKEHKVWSSWMKYFVLSTTNYDHLLSWFSPICFTKTGKTLGSSQIKTLVRLNNKGELLKYRKCEHMIKILSLLYFVYEESLLSTPKEFEKTSYMQNIWFIACIVISHFRSKYKLISKSWVDLVYTTWYHQCFDSKFVL